MSSGFPGRPKILKGAFIEYGISIPPLWVAFQFNPEQLTRSRNVSYSAPNANTETERTETTQDQQSDGSTQSTQTSRTTMRRNNLRAFHQRQNNASGDVLNAVRLGQNADPSSENLSFDIRLDASDDLNDGNVIAAGLGILPQLSTLFPLNFNLPFKQPVFTTTLSNTYISPSTAFLFI